MSQKDPVLIHLENALKGIKKSSKSSPMKQTKNITPRMAIDFQRDRASLNVERGLKELKIMLSNESLEQKSFQLEQLKNQPRRKSKNQQGREEVLLAIKEMHRKEVQPHSSENIAKVQKKYHLSYQGAVKLIAKNPEQYLLN